VSLKAQKPKSSKYPKELKTLGDHIRKKRLDMGLLQAQVAMRIGVTASTIFNWESGKISSQIHYMPKIIDFLGYNPLPVPTASVTDKLIVIRKSLGQTQKTFAKRLGVDPTTLARWEQGKRSPSRKVWKRVQPLLLAACLQFD
jgi:transcriptional regulator with XRE-family HTH domain